MNTDIQNPENNQEAQQAQSKKKPLPFMVTDETRSRFMQLFEKPSEEVLNKLLDALENKPKPDASEQQTDNTVEIARLSDELKEAKDAITDKINLIAEKDDLLRKADSANKKLKSDIESLNQEIESLTQENQNLKEQLNNQQNSENSSDKKIQELKAEIKTLKDDIKEKQNQIDSLQQEKESLQEAYTSMERNTSVYTKELPQGEFLAFFNPITAKLMALTAARLSEKRNDGIVITPVMILEDMFLKYNIQRWSNWFYEWVLTNDDIVKVASEVNPKLSNMRIIRRNMKI